MWRYADSTSGFELRFAPPKSFYNWPKIKKSFGKKRGDIEEKITLDRDLIEI